MRARLKILAAVLMTLSVSFAVFAATVATPQVQHQPAQPKSAQPVTITAQLNSFTAVSNVTLRVQVVEPGAYLRKTDAAYTNDWREFPMSPRAGGFAAAIPAELQQHRRLVRYVVMITDRSGTVTRLPSATNDCPNFAYFVSDGLGAWTGASQPGKTPLLTFPSEFMDTLPAYQIIARREDVEQSQWDGGANKKRFPGTMIYDGRVYDHIQFHNRGKASTHARLGQKQMGLQV